jgi:hypothetical protein
MKNIASNLKVKLEALLKPNPHEHERYLACCTLLVKSQPTVVCDILDQHPHLLTFIFQLIRWKNDSGTVMKRVGLRILYLYLSNVKCNGNLVTTQDWRFLVDLLVQRCRDGIAIDVLDVELLQILNLAIDKAMKKEESSSGVGIYPNNLYILPDLIMNRFIISAGGNEQDESCKTDRLNDNDDGHDNDDHCVVHYGEMMQFLKTILDSDNEDIQDLTIHNLFCENMVLFLACYASSIQSKRNQSIMTENPLTVAFFKNTNCLLFGHKHHLFLTHKVSHHVPILLHYALLVFLSQDVSFENDSVIQSEIEKTTRDDDLISLLQKLVLSGITSLLDSTCKSDMETMFEIQSIQTTIRPMTINILATLLETCGVDWTKTYNDKNTGTLGKAGNFCTILRLVAGELRILLGRIVDQSMRIKEDDNDIMMTETTKTVDDVMTNNDLEVFHTCRDCIRIGLLSLKQMLDLASDSHDKPSHDSLDFNTDSILHIRHSLEDFLNSCIQFVLEEANPKVFVYWNDCAHQCCRFIGAYLSQINIFDYDVVDNDEDPNYTLNSHSTQIDTVTILRAIQQSIDICFAWDDEQDGISQNKAMTIFPCLLSILTCCDESRHASLVAKYLFQSTNISSTIEHILNRIESSSKKDPCVLYENVDVISWCCFLITAMVGFQSTKKKQVPTKIIDKQSMASVLTRVSEQYFDRIKGDGVDPQLITDFGNILILLLDAWKAVTSDDHVDDINMSNNGIMMNVYSFLRANGIV